MSEAAPPSPPADANKGSGKIPLIAALVGALNLGATGFVTTKVLHIDKLSVAAAARAETEGHGGGGGGGHGNEHGAVPVAAVRPVVGLDPFIVNLNEPGSSRYLKATFEIEVQNEKIVESLNGSKRQVRDEILRFLSGLSVPQTQGEQAKAKVAEEVLARVNKILGAGRAHQVFFAEFVVQ